MADREWYVWLSRYVARFLAEGEPREFIDDHWRKTMMAFSFDDAVGAIGDVALDHRTEARFARHHLRLLVEYASVRRDNRLPSVPDDAGLPPIPVRDESWDELMAQRGVISKKELLRRKNDREKKESGR